MIAFDSAKLTYKIIFLKQVTTALGGSILYLNHPSDDIKQAVRVDIPTVVARNFIKQHDKITKYLNSVPVAIVLYDNEVVAMERHPLASLGIDLSQPSGVDFWMPTVADALQYNIPSITANGDWFFDGRYAYSFGGSFELFNPLNNENVSVDAKFKVVDCKAVDLFLLQKSESIKVAKPRQCLCYVAGSGAYGLTSPIWESAQSIASSVMKDTIVSDDDDIDLLIDDDNNGVNYLNPNEDDKENHWMDKVNDNTKVNLAFALYCGTLLGKVYDYDKIDALRLPELMIEMKTVNLPNVASSIRSSYPIGMSFNQALAWLIGMLRAETNAVKYKAVLRCIKYLCKRGTFKRDMFDGVFINAHQVPLLKTGSDRVNNC